MGCKINKNKSAILILDDDGTDPTVFEGYPVVSEYKYLGVLINNKLSPKYHLSALRLKLKDYLKRNRMLHKDYFTPVSFFTKIEYFVKSRLSYGL